jgi:hypothetical protein
MRSQRHSVCGQHIAKNNHAPNITLLFLEQGMRAEHDLLDIPYCIVLYVTFHGKDIAHVKLFLEDSAHLLIMMLAGMVNLVRHAHAGKSFA